MTVHEQATVYVVDDDDAVRRSLLFLLQVEGFAARGFASAEDFLAAVPKPGKGCIVTDMRMHGVDGADLLRTLKEQGIRLTAIVITGHGDPPAAARAVAAGAFRFIEKPFLDTAILEAVRAALAAGWPGPARMAPA